MLVRSAVVVALVAFGCRRPPAPGAVDAAPAPDAAVTATADGGVAPHDPCGTLAPDQRDLVVARVGERRLTLCDFARRVNTQNPYLRARFNAPEQRRALLQSWIDAELLAAEAQAQGIDQEPPVRRAITLQLARRLEQQVREAVPQPTVTDDEVRAYYEAHRAEYETEAQVRGSQIVLATRAQAERTLAALQARPDDDAFFRAQVRALSIDSGSRSAEGDLGFVGREGGPGVEPEVAAALFASERNGALVDHVVESARGGLNRGPGFHIVRRVARREPLRRTLEDESRRIRSRLVRDKYEAAQAQAVQALVEQLRTRTPVQVDEAALGAVRVDAQPPPPGAGPGVPGLPGLPGLPTGAPGAAQERVR